MKTLITLILILLLNPLFSQSDSLYQAQITYHNTLITAQKWYYQFNPGGESVCVIGDTTYLENNQGKKKYLIDSYTIDERLDFFYVNVTAKGSTGQIRFTLKHDKRLGPKLRFTFSGGMKSDTRLFSSSQDFPAYFLGVDEIRFRNLFYTD